MIQEMSLSKTVQENHEVEQANLSIMNMQTKFALCWLGKRKTS